MDGKYNIVVDGEDVEVIVRRAGDDGGERRFLVTVGGREHEVRVKKEAAPRTTNAAPGLDLGSVSMPVPRREERSAPKPSGPSAPASVDTSSQYVVTAPMTGKIVSAQVEAGQQVNEGDLLLVLEAMKMENSILATQAGVVQRVAVKAGDGVRKGDELCILGQVG